MARQEGLLERGEAISELKGNLEANHSRHSSLADSATRSEAAEEVERLTNSNTIPKVRKCNVVEFKNRFNKDQGRYAVDVLLAGARCHQELHDEQQLRERHPGDVYPISRAAKRRANALNLAKQANADILRNTPVHDTWIHRIRLQAPALLKILANIQGEAYEPRPQTHFRPFSTLIYFQPKMKAALRDLESSWGSSHEAGDATPANTTRGHTPNPMATYPDEEEPIDNSFAALAILRCYVDFVDKEVMPLYTQFDRLGVDDGAKVRFSDLYYLFRTGELIYRDLWSEIPGQRDFRIGERLWRTYGIRQCDTRCQIVPSDHRKYDVQDRGEEDGAFVVRAYYLEYTGEEFCVVTKSFSIQPYLGLRDVTSLPIFPVRFGKDHEQLLEEGVHVGNKLLHFLDVKHGAYNALTVMKTPKGDAVWDADGVELKKPEHINSEVMIDFSEAFQACPTWRPKRTILKQRQVEQSITEYDDFTIKWWSGSDRALLVAETSEVVSVRTGVGMWEQNEYVSKDTLLAAIAENDATGRFTKQEFLRREDKVLMACRVFAYIFQERKFAQLDIQWVNKVSASRDALDSLRIPQKNKDTIQDSVRGHLLQKAAEKQVGEARLSQDIIGGGKGTGLFILLYGAPGVGKTATAEAIAQTNGKPLFKITIGDLGLTPESVESKLNAIFRLASLWDCILLMDEVDTFFSQRTKGDSAITKNALVSVFLRILDFYAGILFMTTNLPGALDEAFKSRIHYKILYPPLDAKQTIEIWQINLNRLRKLEAVHQYNPARRPMEIPDAEILRFAEVQFASSRQRRSGQWSGRQIRNAFQVARGLAYADADAELERLRASGSTQMEEMIPAPRLRERHFQVMGEVTDSYDRYIRSVFSGHSEEDLAKQHEHRDDGFTGNNGNGGNNSWAQRSHLELYESHSSVVGARTGAAPPSFDGARSPSRGSQLRPKTGGGSSWIGGPALAIPKERRSPSPMPMRMTFDEPSENGPFPGQSQVQSHLLSPNSHRLSVEGQGQGLGGSGRPTSAGGGPASKHVKRESGDYESATERSDVEYGHGYGDCRNEHGKRARLAEPRELFS